MMQARAVGVVVWMCTVFSAAEAGAPTGSPEAQDRPPAAVRSGSPTTEFVAPAGTMTFTAGHSRLLKAPGLTRYDVVPTAILRARSVGSDGLLLTPLMPGRAALALVFGQGDESHVEHWEVKVAEKPAPATPEAPVDNRGAVESNAVRHILLRRGQTQVEQLPPELTRLAVGDPSVCDITMPKESPGQVSLRGAKLGDTRILVWRKSGERQRWDVTVRP